MRRVFTVVHLLVIASTIINCVQIDNELVSKPHSCFERIAIGAMLPFEKTFRRSDTNQLDACTNLCLNDQECMTFAFGISSRGNGTCQLSSLIIDATKSSPPGTIFDPDFDLYGRKTTNCLVDPGPNTGSQFPRPGGLDQNQPDDINQSPPSARPTSSSFPPSDGQQRPKPTVFIPPSTAGTYTTDDGTTSGDFATSSIGSTYSSESNPTRPDDLYNIQNKFPTTYPTTNNRIPQTSHQPETSPTPQKPQDPKRPPPPPPPLLPQRPHFETNRPDHINIHNNPNLYPIGHPDPFPDYFPQSHPNYHFHIDNFDEKDSHFSGIYAPNAHSQHPNRFYAHQNVDNYGLYPSGRYPESGISLGHSGYNSNRKNGYQVTENFPDMPKGKSCFRRVLAGKRVASHWVRRTLICERLEDCQKQCSDEKRFPCEGFNYRLDPSGRGQGECELVEVPLAQMDLYSSPHNRDSTLIAHHDYDYYERDRSSTNCRSSCIDCGSNPNYLPSNNRPSSSSSGYKPSFESDRDRDRYRPEITAIDKYRPQNHFYENRPGMGMESWDRYGGSNFYAGGSETHYRPSMPSNYPDSRPPPSSNYPDSHPPPSNYPDSRPPPQSYPDSRPPPSNYPDSRPPPSNYPDSRPPPSNYPDSRPPPSNYPDSRPPSSSYPGGYTIDRFGVEEGGSEYHQQTPYRPGPTYIDSGDFSYHPPPNQPQKPYDRPERPQPPPSRPISTDSGYNRPPPSDNSYNRPPPQVVPLDNGYNRPPQKPSTDYDRPDAPYGGGGKPEPPQQSGGGGYGGSSSNNHHHEAPIQSPPPRPMGGYHEREPPRHPPYHPTNFHQKPSAGFVPYLIGQDSWGMYGGTYGSSSYRPQVDYWGLKNEIKRVDGPHQFNYFELGPYEENSVYNRYGHGSSSHNQQPPQQGGMNWGSMWTRRPGMEECSVKTSEGFRLHKGVVRNAQTSASLKECEKMCYSEDKFKCNVFSYRYSEPMRDNCLLCDRSFSLLDSYADIVPDRNYDIYAMSDDTSICKKEPPSGPNYNNLNDQCFIRYIDHKRFYKAIVRDSLTVHTIKDCEIECIKTQKFTCRSFTFRYGTKTSGTIIDNCQLSDWPVRDMDHDRHLIPDDGFDVFERASYGRGCEIVPHDHNHQNPKLCYLGYGSAAKLLSSAIKKIISVSSELECKNECIRYRDTSPFKCLSFSYGSQASTFNCEMSDLDQSELKVDVHYTHTPNRDFWLFAWNPWDYTCRDKITSISGNRINSDRRMDIFREPGGISTWRHYTVSGKPCRLGTKCEKNHIAGFYSCEIEGGEIGSWDFCCRDDHPCGFSRDFDYPWCYVGIEKEQWRSCSVTYLPIHTQQYQGSFSTNRFTVSKYPNKKNDIYQSPPRPGGFQRDLSSFETQLHPLQYLYFDGPPNSTEISSNVIDCNRDRC